MTFPITVGNLIVFASATVFGTWLVYRLLCFLWPPGGFGLGDTDFERDVPFEDVPNDDATQTIRARVAVRLAAEDEDERATREWPAVLRGGAAREAFDRAKALTARGRSEHP